MTIAVLQYERLNVAQSESTHSISSRCATLLIMSNIDVFSAGCMRREKSGALNAVLQVQLLLLKLMWGNCSRMLSHVSWLTSS